MTKRENDCLKRLEEKFDRLKEKVDSLEKKFDGIFEKIMDPDEGLFFRVNENTQFRKRQQRLLNVLLSGILTGILALLFFVIQNGVDK